MSQTSSSYQDQAKAWVKTLLDLMDPSLTKIKDPEHQRVWEHVLSEFVPLAAKHQQDALNLLEAMQSLFTHPLVNPWDAEKIYQFVLFGLDEIYSQLSSTDPLEIDDKALMELFLSLEFEKPEQEQGCDVSIEPKIPVEIFHEEMGELLEAIALQVRDGDFGDEQVNEIKRALHTLKGSAKLVGFARLGGFVHEVESEVNQSDWSKTKTLMQQMVHLLTPYLDKVLAKQDAFITMDMLEDVPLEAYPTTVSEAPIKSNEDKIRLPLSLIERFSQLVAATNVSGTYAELEHHQIRAQLSELHSTVLSLKALSRDITLQADTAIAHQASHSKVAQGDFDSLEFDQFGQLHESVRRFHEINQGLGELASGMMSNMECLESNFREQRAHVTELNDGLMHARLIGFEAIVPRLERMVEHIAQELGKEVTFEVHAQAGAMDRAQLESLVAPLEHMIRNALDHGIEDPITRFQKGKPKKGSIEIHLKRQGSYVIIELKDDGGGIDLEAVKTKAKNLNLIEDVDGINESTLLQVLLLPGFSTSESVTTISGRGIGMDVVHAMIRKLNGRLEVDSIDGLGTSFKIQLPFTTSMSQVLVCRVRDQWYGILTSQVRAVIRHQSSTEQAPRSELEYLGESYQIGSMEEIFHGHSNDEQLTRPMILLAQDEHRIACAVDEIIGTRACLVRHLGPQTMHLNEYLGGALMGDGNIVLVVDPVELFAKELIRSESVRRPTIMVVDDSVTVRKATARLLSEHGYEVVSASNGLEALERLKTHRPNVMLLDIEMPKMDGFTLLEHLKGQNSFPVIMISSRSGPKHRERAMSLGVVGFMSKPYQDDLLLTMIHGLVEGSHDE